MQVVLGERLDPRPAAQLDAEAIGDPLTMAFRCSTSLALPLLGLGYSEKAIVLLSRARQARQALLGVNDAETLPAR